MPASRNPPTRSSQRRNSIQDDTPLRPRAGRGGKSASSKPDPPQMVPPKASPTKLSPNITRKATRAASNISGNSFEAAPEIYASYEEPLFMVFGVPPEFFHRLRKHHGKLPKERKVIVSSSFPHHSPTPEIISESESESVEESEVDEHIVVQSAPRGGRGRGGRGVRGGRGGRGRGRGRGGRQRGGSTRAVSPTRSRPARHAAPMFPLTEEEDQPSSQTTPDPNAKPTSRRSSEDYSSGSDDINMKDINRSTGHIATESDESDDDYVRAERRRFWNRRSTSTPLFPGPVIDDIRTPIPIPGSVSEASATATTHLAIPKISLPTDSTSRTPRDSPSTPPEPTIPRLLVPDDDVLSETDLPGPWIEDAASPVEDDCDDKADYLLQKRYKPLVDLQDAMAAINKFPISQRSTEILYALSENFQRILKAWQDEYLILDARTAPHMHPAKKACNGGRVPIAPDVFEDMKEAELYGYTYDPKKLPGCQDPWAQRPGAEKSGGRELRTRRARDMLDSAAPSEEEDEEDNEGRPAKRQRKATRKYDGTEPGTGTNTPKKHNGWGGARKKGVSRFAKLASETPEPEGRSAKRAKLAATNLLHPRIQEMREESVIGSSGDEGSSVMDMDEYSDTNPKRGRPLGSKNVHRRSDYGIKKGPRKKTSEAGTRTPSAHGPNAPPQALNSLSEGQGQFTIDQSRSDVAMLASNSAESVFQATPQPSSAQELPLSHPSESSNPDAYMITAPLSQYTSNYVEDSSPASGSRRKPRVKSEKRSQSMTIWWAERKARKKEQDEKNGGPTKLSTSRSNSASRRGGRMSGGPMNTVTSGTPQSAPLESRQIKQPSPVTNAQQHAPTEAFSQNYSQPPPPGPPQHYMYVSAPPPQPMVLQYSPLAAVPSGSFPTYSGPPPIANPQFGPRALAPAPMPLQQVPTYPSPYGPQSPAGPRPKSSGQAPRSGPPPLAPAPPASAQPQHFSPYAPIMERQFKVMVAGPAPAEARRESR